MKNIPSLEQQQASVPFVESTDFREAFHAEMKPDVDSMSAEEITAELSRRGIDPEPSFKAVHAMLDAAIAAPDFGEPWKDEVAELSSFRVAILDRDGKERISMADRLRAVAGVNAVAGMQDPAAEIQAMRTAIREAHELLISLEYEGNEKSTRCISCGSHCSDPHKLDCAMLSALAKLKPFLP